MILTLYVKNLEWAQNCRCFSKKILNVTLFFQVKKISEMEFTLGKGTLVLNKRTTKASWSNNEKKPKKS